jgi:uncharacterized phiE125 gp8 family phage protein
VDYTWTVTTPAAAPNDIAVTVALARQQCRIPDESFDESLELMIRSAMRYVENKARLLLCPQTIRVQWERFPCLAGWLELPLGPVRGTVTLEYVASDAANSTTWTTLTGLQSWTDGVPPRLAPAVNENWPTAMPQAVPAVRATYTAGYATAAAIPSSLRQAILMIVRANYESPDGFNRSGEVTIPMVVDQLIATESKRGYP